MPNTTQIPTDNEPSRPNPATQAKEAHFPVIRHAAERIVKREVHRVLDAAGRSLDNADFSARLDKLYDEHRNYTHTELMPSCRALWTAVASAEPNGQVDDALAHCVSKYIRESRETLAIAYDDGTIEAVCDDWSYERAESVAETVTTNLVLALGVAGELERG